MKAAFSLLFLRKEQNDGDSYSIRGVFRGQRMRHPVRLLGGGRASQLEGKEEVRYEF